VHWDEALIDGVFAGVARNGWELVMQVKTDITRWHYPHGPVRVGSGKADAKGPHYGYSEGRAYIVSAVMGKGTGKGYARGEATGSGERNAGSGDGAWAGAWEPDYEDDGELWL
jgi:hypothetical protein